MTVEHTQLVAVPCSGAVSDHTTCVQHQSPIELCSGSPLQAGQDIVQKNQTLGVLKHGSDR